MSERTYYFAVRAPKRCPACGSEKIIPIVYGLPVPAANDAAEAGEIMLGGCCLSGRDPRWVCRACDTFVYPEALRDQLLGEGDPA